MAWDLFTLAWKAIESTFAVSFISALAGASAGALGAQRVIDRTRRREELLREIRNTNAAVMVAFTIANTTLGVKRQLVKPVTDQFRTDRDRFRTYLANGQDSQSPKQVFHFQADMRTFVAPSFPLDTLKTLVFDRISAYGKALSLVPQIENAAIGLTRSIEERRVLVAEFKKHHQSNDAAWAMRYFGEKMDTGQTHREFADLVEMIESYTDDVIYFSAALAKELVVHGEALHASFSKRFGKGAPRISAPDFSGPKKSGLFPPDSNYQIWAKWITERDGHQREDDVEVRP